MDGQIIGYTCKGECANCPAKDAKDKEIERLKKQVADREDEGYAGFVIGVEQMKKRLAEKDKEIERLKEEVRGYNSLAHKGNCRQCEERLRKIIKEEAKINEIR
jgi:Ribonuclease G/E